MSAVHTLLVGLVDPRTPSHALAPALTHHK
jgi:hypothetical protein